jgi:hypothetical protein
MGAPDDFDLPFDFSDLGAFTSGTETLSLETREENQFSVAAFGHND